MMTESSKFYTASMARLYADQGYLRKAAEIYRHLASRNPGDLNVSKALEEIECEIERKKAPTRKDAELLLREWIDLLKQKRRSERNR